MRRSSKDSVVGLIGTNGAGKTTFINMITGYIKPDAGSIVFNGRDITALPPRDHHAPGHLPLVPDPAALQLDDGLENMMMGLGVVLQQRGAAAAIFSRGSAATCPGYGVPAEEVAERILQRFGLASYRNRTRAGAARRRAQAARHRDDHGRQADDAAARRADQRRLRRGEVRHHGDGDGGGASAEGATVLFVEHDMEVVSRFSQRVLAFYDGRIIADAAPEMALADPEVQALRGRRRTAPHGRAAGRAHA